MVPVALRVDCKKQHFYDTEGLLGYLFNDAAITNHHADDQVHSTEQPHLPLQLYLVLLNRTVFPSLSLGVACRSPLLQATCHDTRIVSLQ